MLTVTLFGHDWIFYGSYICVFYPSEYQCILHIVNHIKRNYVILTLERDKFKYYTVDMEQMRRFLLKNPNHMENTAWKHIV